MILSSTKNPTLSLGELLKIDFNIDFLNSQHQPLPQSLLLANSLKSAGYQKIVSGQGHYQQAGQLIAESPLLIDTIPCYTVEQDIKGLLAKKNVVTFGSCYLLLKAEANTSITQLAEAVFQLQLKGYTPVLARAEHYALLQNNYKNVETLLNRGCLLSVELLSLGGTRGKAAQKLAERLFKEEEVSFVGTGLQTVEEEKSLNKILASKVTSTYLQSKMIRNKELA